MSIKAPIGGHRRRSDQPTGLGERPPSRRGRRAAVGALTFALLAVVGLAVTLLALSRVGLAADGTALARVDVGAVGGKLISVRATGPHGGAVPLTVSHGVLTPSSAVPAGATIVVDVRVKRPGWIGWAIGGTVHRRLTVRTPSASVATRWMTLRPHEPLRVAFDQPVQRVAYGQPGNLRTVQLRRPQRRIDLGQQGPAGVVSVAAAPRTWERLPSATPVSWFPAGSTPAVVADPAPGMRIAPTAPLVLSFSEPVSTALGSARPTFATPVSGRWQVRDSHTLVFQPSGTGYGLGAQVHLTLPKGVRLATTAPAAGGTQAAGTGAASANAATTVTWTVPPGSTLRLHELLAGLGYLPVSWHASGADVGTGVDAQMQAAVDPPPGDFSWNWDGAVPAQLKSQWNPSASTAITRGAVMAFQSDHGLTADGFAGPKLWSALFDAVRDHKANPNGYGYVLVHRDSATQTLDIWHNGKHVLQTPANTGVASAPTVLGTFPVFLRYPVTTMSGTNPDGSHYSDPGIKYVSYFNGGDALHAFDRASFGTPQSVGCVELPLAAAAKIYPLTPIGTLVTIAP